MSEEQTTKDLILDIVSDCVTDLLYYDRKECEDLPVGAIDKAILSGEITIDEMVDKFREELTNGLGDDINAL